MPPETCGKELKVKNTKVQIVIIDGNPPIPEQFVNAFNEEKCEIKIFNTSAVIK